MLCINHISYLGLKAELISISLETKRSGDDEDNATLKIDTWQAAQWNYLKYLLVRAGGEAHAETALDELGILPAIITQGYQWSFAAATRENSKTVSIPPLSINRLGYRRSGISLHALTASRYSGLDFPLAIPLR
jgi:hypothetical protein